MSCYKIETSNPYNNRTECYYVVAENEYDAKIYFSSKFPSFKIREIELVNKNVILRENIGKL